MIKVIASDMDGTFLNDAGEFDNQKFQKQLDQMQDKNMHFICATSNTYAHSLRQFHDVKGPISYVCDNGAHVIDERGVSVVESPMEPMLVQKIVEYLQTEPEFNGAEIILAGRNGDYCNLPADSDGFKASQRFYEDLQSVSDLNLIFDTIYKIDVMVAGESALRMAHDINVKFVNRVTAVSSGMNGVDIMSDDTSKATGIQALLDEWNLTFDDVAAFGDNANDYAMLSESAEGFAMKNAADDLLAIVSNVTELTNNEAGVQTKIDEYLK
ncbi:Cof-type HAD-IIB family hydrolase [Lentilactobacillus sp. SPB1-3]|uniref:Cof-type HAD-IIB family hydrolase n=1 Tax=Lentilactobacillus terminaliae TaxID=3003483 RepID=A0ACD5DGG4_9LACO|nr:Cof-type HAD-IIB family hydrolase [Lentilactobacillus sp. SPB1-3]MCZ0976573.1 Cof-type HAD-IIB family hydrolase [Lentilactobacillus sp. SPB1-3]